MDDVLEYTHLNILKTNQSESVVKILTVIAASLAFAAAGNSEETKDGIIEKIGDLGKASPMAVSLKLKASPIRDAAVYGSGVRLVVATNSTIQPGAFMDYGEVPVDFGGAETVAISILAPTSNLTGATILAAWAAPGEFFVATDTIRGSALVFPVQAGGGGRVPVYGSALRLFVSNDGTAPITIKQLTVYAYIH